VFDSSAAGTITLTTGQLDIFDDVTITGLGAADSIISGYNNSRIFYIYNYAASLTVSISGLTMTDGYVGNNGEGGAIANWGNDLTLSSVVLTGNSASGDGGAIWSQSSASPNTDRYAPLTISDSEISENTASGYGGLGLNQVGDVTITNTVVSGNTANASKGGGASFYGVGNVSIVNSVFQYNTSNSQGAGINLYQTGDVSIDSTTFDQNISTCVIAAVCAGGGVYAFKTDSFTMTNSTVSGNEASYGAGIHLGVNGDVLIANSTIANNVANDGDGGALYSWESNGDTRIMFSTISGNSSTSNIVRMSNLYDNEVEIVGTIISDNTTSSGSGTQAVDLYLYGSPSSELTVSSSLIMGTTGGDSFTDGGGNVFGVSAQLGVLADNGGETFTMEPGTGSPVIDAGPLLWTPFIGDGSDQRSGVYLRVYNDQSDMGAFEVQPEPAPPTTTTTTEPSSSSTTLLGSIDTTTTVGTDPVVPAFTG